MYGSSDKFLSKLNPLNLDWYDNGDTKNHWVFRGHSSADYELLPGIYRESSLTQVDDYINNFTNCSIVNTENLSSLSEYIINRCRNSADNQCEKIEARLTEIIKVLFFEINKLERFLIESNNVGLHVPTLKVFKEQNIETRSVDYLYHQINSYIKLFLRMAKYPPQNHLLVNYEPFLEFDFPEAVALAQHHGVPTRYLDWSWNPYVAAFFAANGSDNKSEKICVWALNTKALNGIYRAKGVVKLHKKLSRNGLEFLHNQKGLFTDMLGAESYYYFHGKWPTLGEYLDLSKQGEALQRIDLDSSEAKNVLDYLDNVGINLHSLMPTYDNIGKLLRDK